MAMEFSNFLKIFDNKNTYFKFLMTKQIKNYLKKKLVDICSIPQSLWSVKVQSCHRSKFIKNWHNWMVAYFGFVSIKSSSLWIGLRYLKIQVRPRSYRSSLWLHPCTVLYVWVKTKYQEPKSHWAKSLQPQRARSKMYSP